MNSPNDRKSHLCYVIAPARKTLLTIAAFVLTACASNPATVENYNNFLDKHVGISELSLINIWGPPDQSYDAGGHKFLTYVQTRNIHLSGIAPTYQTQISGDTAYTRAVGGVPASDYQMSCVTVFEIVNGSVETWKHKGNDCTMRAPKK